MNPSRHFWYGVLSVFCTAFVSERVSASELTCTSPQVPKWTAATPQQFNTNNYGGAPNVQCSAGAQFSSSAAALAACMPAASFNLTYPSGSPYPGQQSWNTTTADTSANPHVHRFSRSTTPASTGISQSVDLTGTCAPPPACPTSGTAAFGGDPVSFPKSADNSACFTDSSSGLVCQTRGSGITMELAGNPDARGRRVWTGAACSAGTGGASSTPAANTCQTVSTGTQVCQTSNGITINGRLVTQSADGGLSSGGASIAPGSTSALDLGPNGQDGRVTTPNTAPALVPGGSSTTTISTTTTTTTSTYNYYSGAQVGQGTGDPGSGGTCTDDPNTPADECAASETGDTKIDETGVGTTFEHESLFDQDAALSSVEAMAAQSPGAGIDYDSVIPKIGDGSCNSISWNLNMMGRTSAFTFPGAKGCGMLTDFKALLAWVLVLFTVVICVRRLTESA